MKKSGRETVADRMTNVLFTLPALLLYCVFFIYPVLLGINYSFTDWNGIAKEYTYIGFIDYFFILGLLKVVFNYLFFSKYVVSLHHNVFCLVEIHFCPHFTVRHETIKNIQ